MADDAPEEEAPAPMEAEEVEMSVLDALKEVRVKPTCRSDDSPAGFAFDPMMVCHSIDTSLTPFFENVRFWKRP